MKFRQYRQHLMVLTSLPFWIYSFGVLMKDVTKTRSVNGTGFQFQSINQTDFDKDAGVAVTRSSKIIMAWKPPTIDTSEKIISPSTKSHKNLRKSVRKPTYPYNLVEETVGIHWRPNCSVGSVNIYFDEVPMLFQMYFIEYANINRLPQNHPCVIDLIRRFYLYPPTPRDVPYQLDNPDVVDPSDGKSKAILRLLGHQV